ncbi:MAG: 2,3-bisphosphoglycerate-dependent phosphoglycerate mutase [Candidatus Westeberhardia cardiocondylae]|nr:2,3-bisphosphoglycerate-dependent phosphoglycerate mutase [Candidatus Westeberhardia cardiocondylae]
MDSKNKIVLVRHGESKWNYENKFTGWTDIDLSEKGKLEAKNAGFLLKKHKYFFDFAYTSYLKRAIHTLWIILDVLDQAWISVEKSWKLNERHYGKLQGLNKYDTIKVYGKDIVKKWRRSYSVLPPKIDINDKQFPGKDIRYSNINIDELPTGESLQLTEHRVIKYWNEIIIPRMKISKCILITAHGNSIRAIINFLSCLNENELINLNIPTATPFVYEFDSNIKVINSYYLS